MEVEVGSLSGIVGVEEGLYTGNTLVSGIEGEEVSDEGAGYEIVEVDVSDEEAGVEASVDGTEGSVDGVGAKGSAEGVAEGSEVGVVEVSEVEAVDEVSVDCGIEVSVVEAGVEF